MTKAVISPLARKDMQEIADYIHRELRNPQAALRILRQFRASVSSLSSFPEMGTPLAVKGKQIIPYRYLVYGNYMLFYHLDNGVCHIDRVLYGRRDYMALLFGDRLSDEE